MAGVIASLTPTGQNLARKNVQSFAWANGLMQERDILEENLDIPTAPPDYCIVSETLDALAVTVAHSNRPKLGAQKRAEYCVG